MRLDVISKMNMTLKEVKDDIATIDYTGTLATPEGGSLFKVNGMDAKVAIQGDQKETVLFHSTYKVLRLRRFAEDKSNKN